ncbi:MAG: metal-sensitive transcriptional regulator [Clostridioides sp.]|jgi:DNA-binding FrmR family transcriptional regulator|nr:metal-sensitive transcriptional regulator [Clostridioides sp.]
MEEKKLSKRNDKDMLIKRLNRIEGQVKGIQKMVDEDRYCVDLLTQISAVRSAINKVGTIILENHIKGCVTNSIRNGDCSEADETIEELMDIINKFSK